MRNLLEKISKWWGNSSNGIDFEIPEMVGPLSVEQIALNEHMNNYVSTLCRPAPNVALEFGVIDHEFRIYQLMDELEVLKDRIFRLEKILKSTENE